MEANSLADMLRVNCRRWADKPAMLYPGEGGFKPILYSEFYEIVHDWAGAIRSLGLTKGDHLVIQSENCKEWAFLDWACRTLGIILIPIYPSLPADQSQYIVKDCQARAVVVSSQEQAEKTASLGIPIYRLRGEKDSIEDLASRQAGSIPMEEWEASIDSIRADDVATIIYTSGTTGQPKGAMLANRAFTFICEQAIKSLPFDHKDTFLSFLPMSHVYERVAGQALPISCGATIAYSKSLMSLAHDMLAVKPTVMLCVPRFLEATRDRIVDAAAKESPLKQRLFRLALTQGERRAKGKFAPLAGLTDALVGKKIRARTGGHMRYFVSGGAALPPHVSYFYQAFNLVVLQGYGLTETAAATCVNHPDRNRPDTVGEPIPGVEVSLADDGEILVRGPSRMIGYFNLPKETAEAIDKDGWFHTGDIGQFVDQHLKITDHKKDLLVLANGKNIAPQPIENSLRESPFISEAVLFGDGNEYVYGLIIPNWERVKAELKLDGTPAELDSNPLVKTLIRGEIDKVNKTLADFEKVKKHALLDAEFSIESGELTPSLKVKRKAVRDKYASVLADLARA